MDVVNQRLHRSHLALHVMLQLRLLHVQVSHLGRQVTNNSTGLSSELEESCLGCNLLHQLTATLVDH